MSSLTELTKEINVRLGKAEQYKKAAREKAKDDNKRAADHRIAAGMLLIEARKKVEAGEAGPIGWYSWCEQNILRSIGDIRKIMRIAGHVDPEAALAKERADTKERVTSARTKTVRPPLDELVFEFNDLS